MQRSGAPKNNYLMLQTVAATLVPALFALSAWLLARGVSWFMPVELPGWSVSIVIGGAAFIGALLAARRLSRPWLLLIDLLRARQHARPEALKLPPLPPYARTIGQHLLSQGRTESAMADIEQQRIRQATDALRAQNAKLRAELKHALSRAEDGNKALRHQATLLASLSHELRTPLTAILGHAEHLGTRLSDREAQNHADSLQRCATSLLSTINDLLDWSRIEAGALTLNEVSFDLADTIDDALAMIAPDAYSKGLELVHFIYHDVPTRLRGDPARLQQIMTNLLSNAVKYTDHGEVVLRIMKDREDQQHVMLRLSVSDTGAGIDTAKLPGLFETYSAAADGKPGSSTGLGLSIVRQLAHAMNGEASVESTPGAGSTFTVTLLLQRARGGAPAIPQDTLRGGTAWLVEQHPQARLALTHCLDYWGMEWREWETIDALSSALVESADPPGFVILGLSADGLTERSVLTLAEQPRPATALVMLLGSTSHNDLQRAARLGADLALPKASGRTALYRALCALALGHGAAAPLSGRRALVVENAVATRALLQQMLKEYGAQVQCAGTGDEALDLHRRQPADIVLVDRHMPGMDGLQVLRALRATENPQRRPTLVLMSAWVEHDDARDAALAGADVVLSKPFDARQLLRALAPWLRQAAAENVQQDADARGIDAQLLQDRELRDLLAEELPDQLQAIETSYAAGDALGLREAAHALHGTAAFYQLRQLRIQAASLEKRLQRSEGGSLSLDLRADITRLRSAVAESMEMLERAAQEG